MPQAGHRFGARLETLGYMFDEESALADFDYWSDRHDTIQVSV